MSAQSVDFNHIEQPLAAPRRGGQRAAAALQRSAAAWFLVAAAGQLIFATYIVVFYGGALLRGEPERWNKVLQGGYIPGDAWLNVVLGFHLMFAAAIAVAGIAQLVPAVRRRAPAIHRWTGRFYIGAAAILSLGGLQMLWQRPQGADLSQHLGISLNALLILAFAGVAWRHARARRIADHRRWALRLFVAVSAVWFFRIGLMLWIVVNQGPVGFDPKTFTGPFLTFLSYADYLVPLALLELYFFAQSSTSARIRAVVAGVLSFATLATAAGVAAASFILWLPYLR